MANVAIGNTGSAAGGVAGSSAKPAADAARLQGASAFEDCYSEARVKAAILTELQHIRDDTTFLGTETMKTAYDALKSWHDSTEDIGSPNNLERLNLAAANARESFKLVTDTIEKIGVVSIIIYAEYHYTALTTKMAAGAGEPDWAAGKREAQQLLRQYVKKMPQIASAAREELSKNRLRFRFRFRPVFHDINKRRNVLCDFANLSSTVYSLFPPKLNDDHPRFEQTEKAVIHACKKDPDLMLPAVVDHFLSEPLMRRTLQGHTDWTTCCAVFANDTRLVSGSADSTLKVWDVSNCQELHTLQGHTSYVTCCVVFANDTRLVSGSGDSTLKVWDLANGQELHTLQEHTWSMNCCAVFANDTRLISGSGDSTLRLWDLLNGQELHTFRGHTDSIWYCAVFANDTRLVSGSKDRTLKVWNLLNGHELHTLQGHTNWVRCCAVFANDTRLVSGSLDKTLKVWDLSNGQKLHTLRGHDGLITCCAVFANDARLVSGSFDSTLKVWDLSNGQELHTLEGHTSAILCCAVFANDARLVSGSSDNTLKLWDLPV